MFTRAAGSPTQWEIKFFNLYTNEKYSYLTYNTVH